MRVYAALVLLLLSAAWGTEPKRSNADIQVLRGRLGETRVWGKFEKTETGEEQFTTEVTFDISEGKFSRTFCGNLQKGLDPYWSKPVRIKYRPTSYDCLELISIVALKEPAKKKSGAPMTRVW